MLDFRILSLFCWALSRNFIDRDFETGGLGLIRQARKECASACEGQSPLAKVRVPEIGLLRSSRAFREEFTSRGTAVDEATDGVRWRLDAHRASASSGLIRWNPNRACGRYLPDCDYAVIWRAELRPGEARFQNALSLASRKSMRHWKI